MGATWPQEVWQALDQLAHTDLDNYGKHVFDRDAFLGTARRKRADQHRTVIDGALLDGHAVTVVEIVALCNPPSKAKPDPLASTTEARERIWEANDQYHAENPLPPPLTDCATCANTGVLDGQLCTCERGRFVGFVRNLKQTRLQKGA